jgi:hypothetical protein
MANGCCGTMKFSINSSCQLETVGHWKNKWKKDSSVSGRPDLVQKKQCLVPLLPKCDVRVLIPKILLKNLNTNIRYLLVPVPFQLFIILENSAFPMYSIPVILKKVVTVVCLLRSKLFFCFLTKAERIFCAGFLMFKEVSRLVLVPSELLLGILRF